MSSSSNTKCWWKCKKANQKPKPEEEEDLAITEDVCPPMPQFDISKCKPLYITPDVKITVKAYPPPKDEEIVPIRYGGRYGIPLPGSEGNGSSEQIQDGSCVGPAPEEDCECVCDEEEDCLEEVVSNSADANNNCA